ncbi:MAG: MgtC/SapB family protein [Patescibacteria group bacterium]
MEFSVVGKLLLSLILGAVIGLERESYERKIDKSPLSGVGSLGVRSFSLITTLGAIAGLLYNSHNSLYLLISVTFMTLLVVYYVVGSIFTKDNGITTELAIIFSYVIGVLISLEIFSNQLIIALVVVVIGILSVKEKLKSFISGVKESEMAAFLSYAIIALVVLPFLPNTSYSLSDIPGFSDFLITANLGLGEIANLPLFNPFNIWKVVVIITGIDIFGYILEKTIGQKHGWILTSLAGGFISSTSTTQSLAQKSKKSSNINRLTAAAILANFSSFIQHLILIASVNGLFFAKSIGYVLSLIVSSLALTFYFTNKEEKNKEELVETKESLQNDKIFSLGPALKFALIFLMVTIFTRVCLVFFGDNGFLLSSALAAATGLDATTINVSQLAGTGIAYQVALLALIGANAVNLGTKTVYGFLQGDRRFAINLFVSMAIIVASSVFGFLLFTR